MQPSLASVGRGPTRWPIRMDAVSDGAPSSGQRPDEKRCLDPRCAPRDGSDAAFDGRFPGSRVLAFGHLPGFPVVFWPLACRLELRGQRRIEPLSLLMPVRGTVARLIRLAANASQ